MAPKMTLAAITTCLLLSLAPSLFVLAVPSHPGVTRLPLRHRENTQAINEILAGRNDVESPIYPDMLQGKNLFCYTVTLNFGKPPQKFEFLVDTGSADLGVVGNNCCEDVRPAYEPFNSTTAENMSMPVSLSYAQGRWDGNLWSDMIEFDGLGVKPVRAAFSVIDSQADFFHGSLFQGILGMAYPSLSPLKQATLFDQVVRQNAVADIFSLQLCDTEGQLWLGGYDDEYFKGPLKYTPTKRRRYYEIDMLDLKINGVSMGNDPVAYNNPMTIVDSGTTKWYLAAGAFEELKLALRALPSLSKYKNFWFDGGCGNLDTLDDWPMLTIVLPFDGEEDRNFTVDVPPSQYLRPLCTGPSCRYRCFSITPSAGSTGTILGDVVMRGQYIVHDRVNQRLGFAPAIKCGEPDKPSSGPYSATLPDLCPLLDPAVCASTCERCVDSWTSAWCVDGTAWADNGSKTFPISSKGGFCWPGSPGWLATRHIENVTVPHFGPATVHVQCNDIVPHFLQCSVSAPAFLALWTVTIILTVTCIVLYTILAIRCCRDRATARDRHRAMQWRRTQRLRQAQAAADSTPTERTGLLSSQNQNTTYSDAPGGL